MIFTLLNLSVFITALIAAVDSARQVNASVGAWSLAIASGTVVGALFALILWKAAEFADIRFSRITSALMRNLCISTLYLIAIFGAIASMETAGVTTSGLLRHLTRA